MRIRSYLFLIAFLIALPAAAAQNGKIFGQVTDEDGKPMHDVSVFLTPEITRHTVWRASDRSGKFQYGGLNAGTYSVAAYEDGYATTQKIVKLKNGESLEVNLTLRKRKSE